MSASARYACPGIATPMLTGDGLLARINIDAALEIDTFAAVCVASQEHGNGIVEITRRGSLQVRGLSEFSTPAFAEAIFSLGLSGDNGPQLVTSPLLGFDPREPHDLRAIVTDLRQATSLDSYRASLSPKVSVLIDSGGQIDLDDIAADVRVRAIDSGSLHVSLGGTAVNATSVGWIERRSIVSAIRTLFGLLVERGPRQRGVALTEARKLEEIRTVLPLQPPDRERPRPAPRAEAIGLHTLQEEVFARGFALPFGFSTAEKLLRFARLAKECGASHLRPAPARALLAIGLSRDGADRLLDAARTDLITEPQDPRRSIVACAGAPACASALLPTRELAEGLASTAARWIDGSFAVHFSGCSKGCAHSGRAAITLVGPDRLVLGGRADDSPQAGLPSDSVAALSRMLEAVARTKGVDETIAEAMGRLGTPAILDLISTERRGA